VDLEDKVQFMKGGYDTTLGYSNEGNPYQHRHVDQESVTNFTNMDGLRRSTRKQLEPKWKRDYVNMRRGEQERINEKRESHSPFWLVSALVFPFFVSELLLSSQMIENMHIGNHRDCGCPK